MREIAISVENLYITSGNRYLIRDFNWQVFRAQRWLLFGENGCGKTTLLSALAGFRQYDKGRVKIFGEKFAEDNIIDLRQKIGWVSSSFFDRYYREERVFDIVLSGLTGSLGKTFAIDNTALIEANALMTKFKLEDKKEYPYDLLSKGERQKVLLARAFLGKPEILILDEPGSGLDVFAHEQMLTMVGQIAEEEKQMTIIYVTHYPEEILPIFDHCLLMKDGSIYAQGSTTKLFQKEPLREFFGHEMEVCHSDGKYTLSIGNTILGKVGKNDERS